MEGTALGLGRWVIREVRQGPGTETRVAGKGMSSE